MIDMEKQNSEQYLTVLQHLDPDLYLIRTALHETGMNPLILPGIIRSVANLSYGSGYGKVQIFMQAHVVTAVKGEESITINQPAHKHIIDET